MKTYKRTDMVFGHDGDLKNCTYVISQMEVTVNEKTKYNLIRTDFYDFYVNSYIDDNKKIKGFLKRIFCKHHYIPLANSHGDIINVINKRTYVVCANCGKGKWIKEFIQAPYSYSFNDLRKKIL